MSQQNDGRMSYSANNSDGPTHSSRNRSRSRVSQQRMPYKPRPTMTSSRSTSTGMSSTPNRNRSRSSSRQSRSRSKSRQRHYDNDDEQSNLLNLTPTLSPTPMPSPSRSYQRPDDHFDIGYQPRSPPLTPTYSTNMDTYNITTGSMEGGGKLQQQRQQHQLMLQQKQQTQKLRQKATNQGITNDVLREEEYNIKIMKEREGEILQINQQMNTVNAIYKDLAGMIDNQEELINQIDEQIELANENTKAGNGNFNEARLRAENPIMEDLFGDKLGSKGNHRSREGLEHEKTMRRVNGDKKHRRRSKSRNASRNRDRIDCTGPIQAMPEEYQEVIKAGLNDMKLLGSKIIEACTMPQSEEAGEYTYRRERQSPSNSYAHRSEQLSQAQW